MPRWSSAGYTLEKGFDALTSRLRARAGARRGIQLLPYISYGNKERLYLRGRVLRERKAAVIRQTRFWSDVLATYRRINTVEIPHARIRASGAGEMVETIADEEGYFACELRNAASPGQWATVEYQLLEPAGARDVHANGRALIPSETAAFGIISDIDDTIVLSHATNLLRLAKSVFLQNARERIAFPGVAALYRALCGEANPIFYVSSGAWNFYDLLLEFLELNALPLGPLLLQDYGFEREKFLVASHHNHKTEQITRILDTYPTLPFVLIGDSGQHDPEIYADVLAATPNRIRAIYIRDVSGDQRDAQIKLLAERTAAHGGELVLVRDSLEAASHASRLGLIGEAQIAEVAAELAQTKAHQ